MSQVRTRKVVKVVETSIDVQTTNVTSMDAVVDSVITDIHDETLKASIKKDNKNIQHSNELSSPAVLKDSFRTEYKMNLKTIPVTIKGLDRHKAAAIKTMQNSNMKVVDKSVVQKGLERIVNAKDFGSLKKVVDDTMSKVSIDHTKVLAQSIATVVEKASANIGFRNVKIQNEASKITVIAQNDSGEAILTEVRVDKDKVDLVSETIGMQDNSCNLKLNEFDREMERLGVKFKDAKAKWTGGNTWLPKAKEVEKSMAVKKKQNERIRLYQKLNINKQKNL